MMFRSVVRCSFALAIFMLSAQMAVAQGTGTSPPSLAQVMSGFPNGGPGLAKAVSDLVGSDKGSLAALIAFAKTANEDQRRAIAQGLAQAAKAYASGGDPAEANQIQQAVASSGLPEFSKAYADAAGDTGTASTGGGGGGGGGGPIANGPTGGQNNGTTGGGGGGTNNQTAGSSQTSVGGSSFFQTTTNTTTTNNTTNQTSPF